jgi:hypothetical protein
MSDDFDGLQHPEWSITMMNRLKKKTRRRRKAIRTARVRRAMMAKTFLVLVFYSSLSHILRQPIDKFTVGCRETSYK